MPVPFGGSLRIAKRGTISITRERHCHLYIFFNFPDIFNRMKQEWQLALVNVLTVMTCNGIMVWSLAPCRSYGNTFRFDLENTIQKLPNNIFENSYPMREFDLQKRVYSFFYKAAEFSLLGLTTGSIQGALSKAFAAKRDGRFVYNIYFLMYYHPYKCLSKLDLDIYSNLNLQ